ncbi:MAG: DUF2214 family protein [Bacteroidales bacterium]|nr:DUF2214 family protein [Bacteroidales bacterium]
MDIFVAYMHYLGIMVMMGTLITQHLLLKPGMERNTGFRLAQVDLTLCHRCDYSPGDRTSQILSFR